MQRVTALVRGEAAVAGGDDEARREAQDVPLPRPRERLVEVVDVEDEVAFRRGEQAEVADRCASPHSWVVMPLTGTEARSAAIGSAAPR